MTIQIKKAVKHDAKLRLAIIGLSGSGKTYTGLELATSLAQGGGICVIDTEHGSASKYADLFEFDVIELDSFGPLTYVEAIKMAEKAGRAVILIDSLSHAWMGKEGALEQVEKARARSNGNGNSFTAWKDVTPMHNQLIDAIISSKSHVIATMRSKTEYVVDTGSEGKGKAIPRKVGLSPVQRDGMEYEFDVVADMDQSHNFVVSKSRIPALTDAVINKPGKALGETLLTWLAGTPKPAAKQPAPNEVVAQAVVVPDPTEKELEVFQFYVEKLETLDDPDRLEGIKTSLKTEVTHPALLASLKEEHAKAYKRLIKQPVAAQ